jgi:uncharacterized protein YdhG (YjbR/CyaY superfamily)
MKPKSPAELKKEKAKLASYLKRLSPAQRQHLNKIRRLAKSVMPKSTEGISWSMPTFRYEGKIVVILAASLFPILAPIQRKFAAKLKGYRTSAGGVQIPLDRPVPAGLVKTLVKARFAEVRSGINMHGRKKK